MRSACLTCRYLFVQDSCNCYEGNEKSTQSLPQIGRKATQQVALLVAGLASVANAGVPPRYWSGNPRLALPK